MTKQIEPAELLNIYEYDSEAGAFVDAFYTDFIELVETGSVTVDSPRGKIVLTLKAEWESDNAQN